MVLLAGSGKEKKKERKKERKRERTKERKREIRKERKKKRKDKRGKGTKKYSYLTANWSVKTASALWYQTFP